MFSFQTILDNLPTLAWAGRWTLLISVLGCALVVVYSWLRAQHAGGFGLAWADVLLIGAVIAAAVGYEGEVEWDVSKPDGTPQKLLDVSQLARAGWTARISLEDGLRSTVEWFRQQEGAVRG